LSPALTNPAVQTPYGRTAAAVNDAASNLTADQQKPNPSQRLTSQQRALENQGVSPNAILPQRSAAIEPAE
jgi:hypothetical protein